MSLPLFAAFAAAIKFTSPGPVFYRAQAVGKGGRLFGCTSSATMTAGASKELHKNYVTRMIKGEITQDGSGKTLKIVDDPRVTKVGRILRKTKPGRAAAVDQHAQGGHEPGRPPALPALTSTKSTRTGTRSAPACARRGISGLWQVVGRSEVSFEDMILLDLYYIYNRSLELDFSILFETIFRAA